MSIVVPPTDLRLLDIRGQSKAVGTIICPTDVPVSHSTRCYKYTMGGQWWPAADPFHSTEAAYGGSAYPITWPANNRTGLGCVGYMLDKLCSLTPPTHQYGIVGNARGSTSLAQEAPGTGYWTAANSRLTSAMAQGTPDTLIFIGGEADAGDQTLAESFADRFCDFVDAYRFIFGDVKVVFPQLGDTPPEPTPYDFWNTVRSQQATIPGRLSNSMMVRTIATRLDTDAVHWTQNGYSLVGQSIALAIFALENGAASPPN